MSRRVLGVAVREVARDVLVGRVASQLAVHAARGPSGWRIVATDLRTDVTVAFGIGASLERAEEDAQTDFVRRMNRAARATATRRVA